MSVLIHDVKQGTQEWLDIRKNKITGTKAADLLTKGKKYAINKNDEFKGNYYTRRGQILEHEAKEVYEKIFDVDVIEPGFITNTLYEDCGYSPDGICGTKLIEIKCFNPIRHNICSVDVPFKILAQVHFGMMMCELLETDLIFYNPDIDAENAFKLVNIKYDTKVINNFIDKLNDGK